MPTRHGQTGWIHKDHQTQREFERLSRDIASIKKEGAAGESAGPVSSPSTNKSDWALTLKHNNVIMPTQKIIQAINFVDEGQLQDADNVFFQLQPAGIEQFLVSEALVNRNGSKQINVKAWAKRRRISGLLPVNTLPDTSTPYSDRDAWKRVGSYWKPENGYFGWYVYGVIDHGFELFDPNDYMLTLVDMHMEQIDGENYLVPSNRAKLFHPEHEGMRIEEEQPDGRVISKNIVIVRGVYKPEMPDYVGQALPEPTVEYIDADHINTNIIFHYTLEVKNA